jgi:hypothetical protein
MYMTSLSADAPTTEITATGEEIQVPPPGGSQPVEDPLVAQMLQTIAQMQKQIALLSAERGVPADPIAAGVQNLLAHIRARLDSGLEHFRDLFNRTLGMDEHPDSATTDMARTLAANLPNHVEGADYVKQLANELHASVLSGTA